MVKDVSVPNGAKHILKILLTLKSKQSIILKLLFRVVLTTNVLNLILSVECSLFALSKMGFAGQLGSSFGFDKSDGKRPCKIRYSKEIFTTKLQTIFEHATIECDCTFKVIKRYDCVQAWHFIDPPYVGSNMGHYSGMFNEQSLAELLELCTVLKGKFMLTMFPNEKIIKYAEKNGWIIHKVERLITACKIESRRKQEEWMVCNYTV